MMCSIISFSIEYISNFFSLLIKSSVIIFYISLNFIFVFEFFMIQKTGYNENSIIFDELFSPLKSNISIFFIFFKYCK